MLSDAQAKTRDDIHRTISGTSNFAEEDLTLVEKPSESEEIEARENREIYSDAIKQAIKEVLTSKEAEILGLTTGLWGCEQKTLAQIARETGKKVDCIRRTKDLAHEKILEFLSSINHPVAIKGCGLDGGNGQERTERYYQESSF